MAAVSHLSVLLTVLYLTACIAKPSVPRTGAPRTATSNFRQALAGSSVAGRVPLFPEGGAAGGRGTPGTPGTPFQPLGRAKRTSGAIAITECTFVYTEEGDFYLDYEGDPTKVCGAMFLAPANQRIQLRLTLDVPCSSGGIVSVTDGWDYQNQYLPMAQDHPKPDGERHTTLCGVEHTQVFESSQNAAQVSYLLPTSGRFAVSVRFVRNPTPCSVMLGDSEVVTLRNFGKRRNCSVTTIYPSVVRILQLQVGVNDKHPNMEPETGTIHKCEKRGLEDFVQVAGLGMATELAGAETVFGSVCGLDTSAGRPMSILCGALNVRLVSSGLYDNAVTVFVKRMETEEEMLSADFFCDAEL